MSAEPWVVQVYYGIFRAVNKDTGTELQVFAKESKDDMAEAKRIAERLNRTEGDER